MKKLLFVFVLVLPMTLLSAQVIECFDNPDFRNGSFEETNNCGFDQDGVIRDALSLGCVRYWYAATGSPDLANGNSGITAQDGENYIRLGANTNGGCSTEAAFIQVDLVPGKIYELSFYHRTVEFTLNDLDDLPLDLNIFATSGLINTPGLGQVGDCLDLSDESQEIYTEPSFFSEEWVKVTIPNITVDVPQTQLVFFPEASNLASSYWLLDDVRLVECACFDTCLPTDLLSCSINTLGNNSLFWNPVPGAIGYIVRIKKDKYSCDCSNSANSTQFFYTTAASFVLPNNLTDACFSWSVQTECAGGVTSQYSESSCFSPEGECSGTTIGGTDFFKSTGLNDGTTPSVFPNPTNRELNFSYQSEGFLSIDISIYSLDGKLIKHFPKEEYLDGKFNKSWTIAQDIPAGIYVVHFNTNTGNFQEKILINKRQE